MIVFWTMIPEQIASSRDSIRLIDVRLPDSYEARHIVGALNNCVLEIAFEDRLPECAPDKEKTTVIYGENEASHEAAAAFGKLQRAGYRDVHVLEGGIEAAVADGLQMVEGKSLPDDPALPDGDVAVDNEESRVRWTGRNLLNSHRGTVRLASGAMRFEHGKLKTAEFALDLRGIRCEDLEGSDLHDVLIRHLENDDFLDVEKFPEAVLVITKAEPVPDAKPGAPDLRLTAGLTLRGETHPVEFEAVSGVTPDGKAAAQAVFSIDRTRWGMIYGSGRFFHRLAGHLVNDRIDFEVKIVGK